MQPNFSIDPAPRSWNGGTTAYSLAMVRLAYGNSPYLRPLVFPTPSSKAARRPLTVRQSFRLRGFLGGVTPSSGSRVDGCAQTAGGGGVTGPRGRVVR